MISATDCLQPAARNDNFTRRCLALLDEESRYLFPRRVRVYQRALLDEQAWRIASPSGGGPLTLAGTVLHEPKSFSYRFESARETFWLISTPIAHGYALRALYDPQTERLVYSPQECDENYFLARARELQTLAPEGFDIGAFTLLVGHPNFAHEIWNEISALLACRDMGGRRTRKISTDNTVLDVDQLLPPCPLADGMEIGASGDWLKGRLYRGAVYALGSQIVAEEARTQVTKVCSQRFPPPEFFHRRGRFRVVLTLRMLYRRAINEEDVFAELARAVLERFENVDLYLDGYSLSHALARLSEDRRDAELHHAAAVADAAQCLLARIPEELRPRLFDGSRLTLPETIACAGRCHFYVAHHGTQQHKFGWLSPLPGIIHANASILASQPAGWVRDQAEGAILPDYVPADWIEDVDDPSNPRNEMPYFKNYRIREPAKFVEFCLERIARAGGA